MVSFINTPYKRHIVEKIAANFYDSRFLTTIVAALFMEVFLSLAERQVCDGIKSGIGKSKLNETTTGYRRLIVKHYEAYKENAG